MATKPRNLPVHAPIATRDGVSSAFARRVQGRREARRIAELMEEAERVARARLAVASREVEGIFAAARAEAEALLARLPDFEAIETAPAAQGKSAYRVIREAADRHCLPIAVVVGPGRVYRHEGARAARIEAVIGVAASCPSLSEKQIGALFSGMSDKAVRAILKGKRP